MHLLAQEWADEFENLDEEDEEALQTEERPDACSARRTVGLTFCPSISRLQVWKEAPIFINQAATPSPDSLEACRLLGLLLFFEFLACRLCSACSWKALCWDEARVQCIARCRVEIAEPRLVWSRLGGDSGRSSPEDLQEAAEMVPSSDMFDCLALAFSLSCTWLQVERRVR